MFSLLAACLMQRAPILERLLSLKWSSAQLLGFSHGLMQPESLFVEVAWAKSILHWWRCWGSFWIFAFGKFWIETSSRQMIFCGFFRSGSRRFTGSQFWTQPTRKQQVPCRTIWTLQFCLRRMGQRAQPFAMSLKGVGLWQFGWRVSALVKGSIAV